MTSSADFSCKTESHHLLKLVWKDIDYQPGSFHDEGFFTDVKGAAPLQWQLCFKNEPPTQNTEQSAQRFWIHLKWIAHNVLPNVNITSASMRFFYKDGSGVLIRGLRKTEFSHKNLVRAANEEVGQRLFEERCVRNVPSTGQRVFSVYLRINIRVTPCLEAFYTALHHHEACQDACYVVDDRLIRFVRADETEQENEAQHRNKTIQPCIHNSLVRCDMLVQKAPFFATLLSEAFDATIFANASSSSEEEENVSSPPYRLVVEDDISAAVTAQFANYCQRGPLHVDLLRFACSLAIMANKYNVKMLEGMCEEWLKVNVNDDNVIARLHVAKTLKLADLRNICLEFLETPNGVKMLEDWMHVSELFNGNNKFLYEMFSYYALRTAQLKQKLLEKKDVTVAGVSETVVQTFSLQDAVACKRARTDDTDQERICCCDTTLADATTSSKAGVNDALPWTGNSSYVTGTLHFNDSNSLPVSYREKLALSVGIKKLTSEWRSSILEIIQTREKPLTYTRPNEIEIDFENLKPSTLRALERFVRLLLAAKKAEEQKKSVNVSRYYYDGSSCARDPVVTPKRRGRKPEKMVADTNARFKRIRWSRLRRDSLREVE